MLNVVAKRQLPNVVNLKRPPTVLMKLDIEGEAMYYKVDMENTHLAHNFWFNFFTFLLAVGLIL